MRNANICDFCSKTDTLTGAVLAVVMSINPISYVFAHFFGCNIWNIELNY